MRNKIRDALVALLTTLTDVKVVVPGERYKPVVGTPWMRIKMENNEVENRTMGGAYKLHTGEMRIEIFYPSVNGTDTLEATMWDISQGMDTQTITITEGALDLIDVNTEDTLTGAVWMMGAVVVSYELFT